MKEHELRVIEEAKELENKCDKLTAFINERSSHFRNLTEAEKNLLIMQLDHMENYFDILTTRISLFEVPEDDDQEVS